MKKKQFFSVVFVHILKADLCNFIGADVTGSLFSSAYQPVLKACATIYVYVNAHIREI